MLITLDIDNTVADGSHRDHFLQEDPPNWTAFISPEEMAKDTVIKGAVEGVRALQNTGATLVFVTGRNEGLRTITANWIKQNLGIDTDYNNLLMRPLGNDQKPTEVKRRLLDKLIYRFTPPWLCIDDDLYLDQVFRDFGAIHLKAPECWSIICPSSAGLPEEGFWRK